MSAETTDSGNPPTTDPAPSPTPSAEPSQQQPTTQPPQSSAQPTTQPPPQSSADPEPEPSSQQPQPSSQQPSPPSSSAAQPTTSAQPTQSSAQPTTQAPSSERPSSAQPSQAPSSQQQSSAAPPTTTSAPPQSSAQPSPSASVIESDATSAIVVTTTDASGNTVTSAPPTITRLSTSTGADGEAITLTQVIRNPGFNNGGSGSGGGSSAFFSNTSAVAGTFVAVGLVCTLGVIAIIAFALRRRRRQRLDRDVAAAAAAASAAAGHHHHRAAFDDDDHDISPPMTQYGGFYAGTAAGTPGVDVDGQVSQPSQGPYHDYEDPAGGYDHYATQMTPMPPLGGAGAGAGGDRFSTATAPGLAGFGAQSAQMNYSQHQNNGYEYPPGQSFGSHSGEEHLAGTGSAPAPAQRQSQGYYYDPNSNASYSYADEPEDAYGGYSDAPQGQGHGQRRGSAGSLPAAQEQGGGLKVTNV